MSDKEIYEKFIEWLGKSWWKLTESEALIPMITTYISPEDAAFLTGMPHSSRSLEEIAVAKNMNPGKAGERLKELIIKGLVYENVRGDSVKYRLNDSFFIFLRAVFWPDKADRAAKRTAPHVNRYFKDGWFDQYADVHHKGLRSIPIEKTIEISTQLLPFEDIVSMVDRFEYYSVSNCPCRQRHNLDPETPDCPHPKEVCLHFDDLGRYTVENGMGRKITREETLDVLRKAADAGLVHAISNWEDKPDTICNCCMDACMWFEAYHKLGHNKSVDASNYIVKVNSDTCKGCALCVKRCPMDALQLRVSSEAKNKVGKVATLNSDACIGCGVCAHKCPTKSLLLEQKEEISKPPKNVQEYGALFMADRRAVK